MLSSSSATPVPVHPPAASTQARCSQSTPPPSTPGLGEHTGLGAHRSEDTVFRPATKAEGMGNGCRGPRQVRPGPPQLQNSACCCRWLSGQLRRSCRPHIPGLTQAHSIQCITHTQQSNRPTRCRPLVHLLTSVRIPPASSLQVRPRCTPLLTTHPPLSTAHPFLLSSRGSPHLDAHPALCLATAPSLCHGPHLVPPCCASISATSLATVPGLSHATVQA